MRNYIPEYVELAETGELDNRIRILKERLKSCTTLISVMRTVKP